MSVLPCTRSSQCLKQQHRAAAAVQPPRPCKHTQHHTPRLMLLHITAAKSRGSEDEVWKKLGDMADKYIVGSSSSKHRSTAPLGILPVQGIHVLLTSLVLVWLLTSSSSVPTTLKQLALEHNWSKWWSLLTDAFTSGSSQLLARNLFFGYMFGRVVENSESSGALWLTFLLSAAGGSTAAWLLLPRRAPIQGCGSTGAMFGLFAMATLFNRRKHWHWQRVFELAVLLPFVCQQLLAGHAGMNQWCLLYGQRMGSWVPLLGGLIGAAVAAGLLVFARLLSNAVAQSQQQQQAAAGGAGAAGQQPPPGDDSMSVLLTKAVTQLLKRVL